MSEEKKNTWKIIVTVIVALLLVVGGFFLGRWTIKDKVKTVIEYVELPPVHDTITDIVPKYIISPADTADIIMDCVEKGIYSELFPTKVITDTMVITKEDTSVILKDWATARYYTETLFDIDTVGSCTINERIQYNRIDSLGYIFTPRQKTVTTEYQVVKVFSPFIGAGWQTSVGDKALQYQALQAEVGFFIKEKYGLSVDYQYDYMQKSHSVGGMLIYKF